MGTRTIHTLAYKLLVDSQEFQKGTIASRKEINLAKREMRSLLTPAEKMENSLEQLGQLAKKDAKFQEVYNRKLAKYEKHLKDSAVQSNFFARNAMKLKVALTGAATAAAGLAASAAWRTFNEQIDRIDKLGKTSDKLGISVQNLTRIQYTAGKVSGLSNEQTAKGMEKMIRRVSEAAVGAGEAQGVLKEIGLDAKQLAAASPDQAFLMIARAMDSVTEEHDRLRIATKLFDDEQAGLHTTLALSNDELTKQFGIADKLGASLNGIDTANASAAKDAMTDLAATFERFSTEFTVAFAPALTDLINGLTPLLNKLTNSGILERISFGARMLGGSDDRNVFAAKEAQRRALANVISERKNRSIDKTPIALESPASTGGGSPGLGLFSMVASAAASAFAKTTEKQAMGTATKFSTSGPGNSFAAGSSEAFKALYQTTSVRQVEVDLGKQQVSLAQQALTELKRIAGVSEGEGPRKRGLETI